jgi:lysophospholipase L1-like esterase
MPQLTEPRNLPPAPFTQFLDTTLRQTIRVTIAGERMRLRLSNVFGDEPLPITAVSVALPAGGQAGVSGIQAGSSRPVTFTGQSCVVLPPGAQMLSDPFSLPIAHASNLTVTIYLADGQASDKITSHPGSRTTSYLAAGNHVDDVNLPTGAVAVEHWYFLNGVETWAGPRTAAAVMVGDSLTDGRGSTTNRNNRWPDRLVDRLQADPCTAGVAIANQAAGGNAVIRGGTGPSVLSRMDRDVLAQSGVAWMFLFEGVNDIGGSPPTPAGQKAVTDDLLAAYDQIILRAQAQGIRVYGATLTPFGGNGYDDPSGYHEAARQAVNAWIRTSGRLDAVVDFDVAVRDPADPRRLLATADSGDHLHLSADGYRLLADAVSADLFDAAATLMGADR